MAIDERIIVQETPHPGRQNREFIERLMDTLPEIKPHDPQNPEWIPTPHIELDLSPYGYDLQILVKDESDLKSNPSGTHKSRKAHENFPVAYRVLAELNWKKSDNELSSLFIPVYSEIGAGNSAIAHSIESGRWNLPPMKAILDIDSTEEKIQRLKKYDLDIYLVPLDRNIITGKNNDPYTEMQIKALTNNLQGIDLTSNTYINRGEDYFDWHTFEALNNFMNGPGQVYVPAGSEELFSHFVFRQKRIMNERYAGHQDPRLEAPFENVISTDIKGATPKDPNGSGADKLTGLTPYRPLSDKGIEQAKMMGATGSGTGVYPVSEFYIDCAEKILKENGIDAEKSGAAGLGLLLQHYDISQVDKTLPILVVNTGKGILDR